MRRWCDRSIQDARHAEDASGRSRSPICLGLEFAETILASVHVRTQQKAGHMNASDLIKIIPKSSCEKGAVHIWHLDEVYLKIDGRMVYLWRAVDAEGEVLDVLVQSKRNKHAALKLMRKPLKKYAFVPERLVTDDLRSYRAATRDLGIERRHRARAMEEQSSREFASANAAAGAQDAAVQERGLSPEVSFHPRRRLQHFQRPTPSHFSPNAPRASRCGDDHVADAVAAA